jgi:hypothetical protein
MDEDAALRAGVEGDAVRETVCRLLESGMPGGARMVQG